MYLKILLFLAVFSSVFEKICLYLPQKEENMIDSIRKYNLWDGNLFDLGFQRTFYTDKIEEAMGNNLVKVLVGQRRAGKSFVLRQLMLKLLDKGVSPNNILYINKEFLEYEHLSNAQDLQSLYAEYLEHLHPEGKTYLFIDEVQQIAAWERFVNSHSQDFTHSCEVFLTGSNSDLLSGELATLLSGRFVEFEILPYSYEEYCQLQRLEVGRPSYVDFLQKGMLPELFNLTSESMHRQYVSSVKDTVMLRDIVQRYKVKDSILLEDLFRYVVSNAGRMFSVSNVVNYFSSRNRKTNYETISSYLDYLQKAFLIHKAERYNIAGKEILSGNAKYYSNDLAYYNYLYRGFAYGAGSLLENAVYLQLHRIGYDVYIGMQDSQEVDFVAMRQDRKIYFQVSWQVLSDEKTMEREYAPLLKRSDQYPRYLITLDEVRLPNNNGVEHLFPWELDNIVF